MYRNQVAVFKNQTFMSLGSPKVINLFTTKFPFVSKATDTCYFQLTSFYSIDLIAFPI